MKKYFSDIPVLLLALLLLAVAIPSTNAEQTYVSINNKFYIDYPDNWVQVPYRNVDMYLARAKAGRHLYNYDAVFAPKGVEPFFSEAYVIISIDTVGTLSETQIDSVLTDLGRKFGKGIKYFPVGDFITNVESESPTYDRDKKIASVITTLSQGQAGEKINLIMMKFFDQGIANFYCFAPDSLFESSKSTFENIINSFGTENYEAKIPKENVKVADIDPDKIHKEYEDDDNNSLLGLPTGTFIALLVVFIIIIARKRKKKKQ